MTHLSDEELKWYDAGVASAGKYLYSEDGDKAPISIGNRIVANSTADRFGCSCDRSSDIYEAGALYYYEVKCAKGNLEGYFSMLKKYEYDSLMVMSDLNDYCTGINDFWYIPIKTDSVMIDGVVLKDCMIFDESNSLYTKYCSPTVPNKLDKYIISKHLGLVYFRFEDGTEYHRRFKKK